MINKLKDIADKREIHIGYVELPQEETMVYIEREGLKLIMIDKSSIDTKQEIKDIALGLGYAKAMEKLDKPINKFKKEDNNYRELIEEIAKCNMRLLIEGLEMDNSFNGMLE